MNALPGVEAKLSVTLKPVKELAVSVHCALLLPTGPGAGKIRAGI